MNISWSDKHFIVFCVYLSYAGSSVHGSNVVIASDSYCIVQNIKKHHFVSFEMNAGLGVIFFPQRHNCYINTKLMLTSFILRPSVLSNIKNYMYYLLIIPLPLFEYGFIFFAKKSLRFTNFTIYIHLSWSLDLSFHAVCVRLHVRAGMRISCI